MRRFYRVDNIYTKQGLWYDQKGNFTGLIHNEFNFCKNSQLPMPFDPEVVGYLSATKTLHELFNWFSLKDIERLESHLFFISLYEASDYKAYNNHWLINQETSKLINQLPLFDIQNAKESNTNIQKIYQTACK